MGVKEVPLLAIALVGINLAYLLYLGDHSPLTKDEWQLIEHYRRTDARGRDVICHFAKMQLDYSQLDT